MILSLILSFSLAQSAPKPAVADEIAILWNRIKNESQSQLLLEAGKIRKADEFAPEARSFEVVETASRILELDPELNKFSSSDKNRILAFKKIYDESISEFYVGRNALTKEIYFISPYEKVSIDQVIRTESFLENWGGGIGLSLIRAETSLSPLRGLIGPGARRINFWPINFKQGGLPVSLEAMRISYMLNAAGIPQAVEIIGRDMRKYNESSSANEGWEPFVYEKVWGRWFPIHSIGKTPVRDFCMRCHTTAKFQFSPFPRNVSSEEMFKGIGYKHDGMIKEFFKYKESAQ